jgi:hypothetical protein
MSYLALAAATAVTATLWLRYRAEQARNYGVAGLSKIAFERFPALRTSFSRCVAVTGGCGFLGMRIVQMLLERFEAFSILSSSGLQSD